MTAEPAAGRRRQARRHDLARRRLPGTPARRHPQGRSRRHARPDGDRRAGARGRPRHPAAGSPDRSPTSGTTPPSGSVRRRRPTTPRARSSRSRSTADVTDGGRPDGPGAFVGEIDQVPTSVSAIKVDGQRAYARVRDGEQVDLPARRVTVRLHCERRRARPARGRIVASTARAAPTSARSPATSGPRSAWAAT